MNATYMHAVTLINGSSESTVPLIHAYSVKCDAVKWDIYTIEKHWLP